MLFNLFLVFILSIILTFLLIKYKKSINLLAHPNHRSMHKSSMPNSGGVAIFFSFLFGIYLFDVKIGFAVVLAMGVAFVFGIYDDIRDARMRAKMLALFVVGNILFFNGYEVAYLGTYMGYAVEISSFTSYIFLIFVIIAFVNAMNLVDGLDGLASSVGIIILGSFLYLGLKYGDDFLTYTTSIYIASLLGFLYFNWNPAKIFMGDSGSLPLGLIIAIVAIHAVNMSYITPITILMLAALPILDTLVVMSIRMGSGLSPFIADKSHIHHFILKQQKNNTKRTVAILSLIQLFFSYIGLGFKSQDDILILFLFVVLFILFYLLLTPSKSKR